MTDIDVPAADAAEAPATPTDRRSRRQLLTLAGAAAVGGTALALGQASPAGAADGDPILAGESNAATLATFLDGGGAISGAFTVTSNVTGIGGVEAQGNEHADIKLSGTGRLGQAAGSTGNVEPAHGIGTSIAGTLHEIVRSDTGVIWASTGTGTGENSLWKRINSPRFDNPNGSGNAFAPFRLIDTRVGVDGVIVVNAKMNSNTTYTYDLDALTQLAPGIVGVFGNITVLNSSYTGFVKLFPGGAAIPPVSNVNFSTGQLVGNFFQVGLSNTGTLSVRPGDAAGGTVDVIIDIFGYVQ